MLYSCANEWRKAEHKKVLLFGMSGLGKTRLASLLRYKGGWFHYSVDYRIATRYMGEPIADNAKAEAMKVPFLRDLLMSDSISLTSNITFDNLAPLAAYLGKPGNPQQGGLCFDEYMRRQSQHRQAEQAALHDAPHFIQRAQALYGYAHFVCDSGGSICEVIDSDNPNDPLMGALAQNMLPVWVKGSDEDSAKLVERFDRAPKPMYYHPRFLLSKWEDYLGAHRLTGSDVDPDAFVRQLYQEAIAHRQSRYAAMARWGVVLSTTQVANVECAADFIDLVASAIAQR